MTPPETRLRARFVVGPDAVHADATVVLRHGRVAALRPAAPSDTDLGDVALAPGLVNAHSHAFQRALRGRTEHLRAGREDEDFWSWRDLMYRTANALDPDDVEAVSRMAFLEMAKGGVTTVGEFHYLHHAPDGAPYADPNALAHRVVRAARDVGLRIALLRVLYHRAGPGRPAEALQRRFVDPDVDTALDRVDALAAHWRDDAAVSVGLAPHSVRAVPRAWLEAVARVAGDRVVHLHACEQRAELEQCAAEHGLSPVALVDACGLLGPRTTLVHATHLDADALVRIARARPTVAACPGTERNLGDGFLPAAGLLAHRVPIALGSDGQADIDLWNEMRLVEYHERLRAERRNVLARAHAAWHHAPADGRLEVADLLWPMATTHGARSLGLTVGALAPGAPADLVALDLRHPRLAGTTARTLLADLAFSAGPDCVRASWVAGRPVVVDGRHPAQEATIDAFRRVMRRLDAG